MIASFRHNFIFLKTQKVGGTSIELALTPSCGPDDIITPLAQSDEVSRVADGIVMARNFSRESQLEDAFRAAMRRGDKVAHNRVMRSLKLDGHFFNHIPAVELAAKLDPGFWRSAFKFTVERHPYEKVVSMAYFRLAIRKRPASDFRWMLDAVVDDYAGDDSRIYTINGKIAVDEVIQFDTLESDLARICARLGVALPARLPRAKAQTRLDMRPAREILSDAQKSAIYERCRATFKRFGYRP